MGFTEYGIPVPFNRVNSTSSHLPPPSKKIKNCLKCRTYGIDGIYYFWKFWPDLVLDPDSKLYSTLGSESYCRPDSEPDQQHFLLHCVDGFKSSVVTTNLAPLTCELVSRVIFSNMKDCIEFSVALLYSAPFPVPGSSFRSIFCKYIYASSDFQLFCSFTYVQCARCFFRKGIILLEDLFQVRIFFF
jgi:hypothetical protein